MTYGDVLTWMPEPDPLSPALERAEVVVHRDLDRWATELLEADGGAGLGGRVLVEPVDARAALADVLGVVLGVYALKGSVVLRAPDDDDAARRRVVDTELVTDQVRVG